MKRAWRSLVERQDCVMPGLLDSALARPVNKFLYEPKIGLDELAAAYCFGIARNHPFVDGNKRAALLALIVFTRSNGLRLVAEAAELYLTVMMVASGEMDEARLAAWVGQHTKRV